MSDGGKGSTQRPRSISQQEYEARWDAIFGRDQQDDKPKQTPQQELPQQENIIKGYN